MNKIRMITRENVPCWYELEWQEDITAIVLRLHKDFIAKNELISGNDDMVHYFKDMFEFNGLFDSFCGDFSKEFVGFNKSLRNNGIKDDFIEFLIDIPRLVYFSDEICKSCDGSGESNVMDGPCYFCGGEGKDKIFDWRKAFEISASLTVITQFLYVTQLVVKSQLPQLLIVGTTTNRDFHGGSLHGELSQELRQWLNRFRSNASIKEAEKAMKLAYCKMFHVKQVEKFDRFDAYIESNGFLILNCPGNACGVHPDTHWQEGEKGYKFSCHNVDTPMQQLTLLAGLAALHDKARREIIKSG